MLRVCACAASTVEEETLVAFASGEKGNLQHFSGNSGSITVNRETLQKSYIKDFTQVISRKLVASTRAFLVQYQAFQPDVELQGRHQFRGGHL